MLDRSSAYRTRISFQQILDINYDIAFIVSAVVDVLDVVVFFISTCAQVFKTYQFAVHNDLAVVKSHRTCKSAYTACSCAHLFFICKFDGMFRNIKSIDQLDHVQLSVASDESCNIAVFLTFFIICHEEQGLDSLILSHA